MKLEKCDHIYANGDSWTYGSELEDPNDSYPYLIGQELNLNVINNAKGGSSNDRIHRTSIKDILKIINEGQVPFVIIGWTNINRFELNNTNHDWIQFGQWPNFPYDEFEKEYISKFGSDYGAMEKYCLQVFTLQTFLQYYKIPYLMFNAWQYIKSELYNKDLDIYDTFADTSRYLHELTLKSYLTIWGEEMFHSGGHPSELGHIKIKELILEKTRSWNL